LLGPILTRRQRPVQPRADRGCGDCRILWLTNTTTAQDIESCQRTHPRHQQHPATPACPAEAAPRTARTTTAARASLGA